MSRAGDVGLGQPTRITPSDTERPREGDLFLESLERRAVGFEREGIAPLLVWGHDYDDIAVIQWGLGHHMQAAGGRHS